MISDKINSIIAKLKLRCIKIVCIRSKEPSIITSLPHNNSDNTNNAKHKNITYAHAGTYLKKLTTEISKNITEADVTNGHGLIGTTCIICRWTRSGNVAKKKLLRTQTFKYSLDKYRLNVLNTNKLYRTNYAHGNSNKLK